MALGFGRKKAAEETPLTPEIEAAPVEAAPVAAHAPSSSLNPAFDNTDAFDLDAFSNAESPSQSFAESPAESFASEETRDADAGLSGSAFEFPDSVATTLSSSESDAPDFDKLYEIEQANAARLSASQAAKSPGAAPAPFVPPSATMQADAVPFYEPQIPVGVSNVANQAETDEESLEKPRKKLPLAPILGALGILALGGAASYMMGQPETDSEAPPPSTRIAPPRPPAAPPAIAAPAPKTVVSSANPVSPGIAPVAAPASAQLEQMRAIWKRGAAAKKRGDYAGARQIWNQGLKIQPGNIGFQESIAKLPK